AGGRRRFSCGLCGKSYRHGGSLANHRHSHRAGPFACPVCARPCPNMAAFRNHLRSRPRCRAGPNVG
ncbi:ZN646 protein, partial [Hemiprocne comata]|nr:ZN646 protein [Hemiprocne comata]